ncbi:MAG: hypothetical protein HY302_09755 [Opitutae bacterium]|nr:hypothetical protein [Opitutae bacterium]
MNSPFHPQSSAPTDAPRGSRAFFSSDLTWGRPVFHPPALPNPRVMLEAFPSLVRSFTRCRPPANHR